MAIGLRRFDVFLFFPPLFVVAVWLFVCLLFLCCRWHWCRRMLFFIDFLFYFFPFIVALIFMFCRTTVWRAHIYTSMRASVWAHPLDTKFYVVYYFDPHSIFMIDCSMAFLFDFLLLLLPLTAAVVVGSFRIHFVFFSSKSDLLRDDSN